jgi:hypothetical protein
MGTSSYPTPSTKRLIHPAITAACLPALIGRPLASVFSNKNPRTLARWEDLKILTPIKKLGRVYYEKGQFLAAIGLVVEEQPVSKPIKRRRAAAVR